MTVGRELLTEPAIEGEAATVINSAIKSGIPRKSEDRWALLKFLICKLRLGDLDGGVGFGTKDLCKHGRNDKANDEPDEPGKLRIKN
jgi:hypothetical protein